MQAHSHSHANPFSFPCTYPSHPPNPSYPFLSLNSHPCKPIPVHASPLSFPCKPILSMPAIPASHPRPSSKPPHFVIFPLPMREYTHSIPILHATHTLFSLMHARTMHPWLPSTPTSMPICQSSPAHLHAYPYHPSRHPSHGPPHPP